MKGRVGERRDLRSSKRRRCARLRGGRTAAARIGMLATGAGVIRRRGVVSDGLRCSCRHESLVPTRIPRANIRRCSRGGAPRVLRSRSRPCEGAIETDSLIYFQQDEFLPITITDLGSDEVFGLYK